MKLLRPAWLAMAATVLLFHGIAAAQTENFFVIVGGENVGHLKAETQGSRTAIEFDYKDSGRGPTIEETITTNPAGIPTSWTIPVTTTCGSKVDKRFSMTATTANWTDPAGTGTANVSETSMYVAQGAS